jgi:hypothetical protein
MISCVDRIPDTSRRFGRALARVNLAQMETPAVVREAEVCASSVLVRQVVVDQIPRPGYRLRSESALSVITLREQRTGSHEDVTRMTGEHREPRAR